MIASKNEALNKSLHRQSILLSEVHHRVKNNLQLVISLLSVRAYKIGDKAIQTHFEGISNKIHSISLIHEQLYQSGEFELINLKTYFTQLTSHFQALNNTNQQIEFRVEIEAIFLNLDTILPLGIICAELISNSLKYGHQPDKQVTIQLVIKKLEDKYHFYYQDNGLGYPNGKLENKSNSMGSMVINSMVQQLKGDSEIYNAKGAVFTLGFQEKKVSIIE